MRFLNSGAAYEDVGRVLGDTVATVEEHYSDLGFTPAFRKAWETAHMRSTMNTTEGTAQPGGWIGSERYGRQIGTSLSYPIHGVRTQSWWRTYQDSNPGFRLRRPK